MPFRERWHSCEITTNAQHLIGRDEDVRLVAGDFSPLVVLFGDSGIGKSALLAQAQVETKDALATTPVEVAASGGALQLAVLDALGSGLADLLTAEPWRGVQASAVDFVRRLVSRTVEDGRRFAGLALVGVLRDRFGDATIDLIGDVVADARVSIDESLANRIAAARVPQAVDDLVALAAELRDLSGRRALVVALDRVEVLPDAEVRMLADMARKLPEGISVRVAVMDTSVEGKNVLNTLRACAGAELSLREVASLQGEAVRSWVEFVGLDGALAVEISQRTGGYPLHVGDALLHLQSGGGLHDLTEHGAFGAAIDRSWDALDQDARLIARQLVVLDRPLPLKTLLDLLGVNDAVWWDAVERLREARVFTQEVDGLPWFHEQRRKWLLGTFSDRELQAYAAGVLPALTELIAAPDGVKYAVPVAANLRLAGDIEDDALRRAAELSPPELAVMASLLELAEPDSNWAVRAEAALAHARDSYDVDADLVQTLADLESKGLVGVASNEHSAVAVPVLSLRFAVALAGFCELEFGRQPLALLASQLWWSLLGPMNGEFETARFGIGSPPPGQLAREMYISELRRTGAGIGRFRACVAYGTHRSVLLYAVVSLGDRDVAAVAESWRSTAVEIADGTFRIDDVLEYPAPRLRSSRWSLVANDLLGREPIGPKDDAGFSLGAELQMLSDLREMARSRMDRTELVVTQMHKPMHYFFDEDGRWSATVEALGVEPGATHSPSVIRSREGPYGFLRLGEAIGLPRGASVNHVRSGNRIDRSHPLRKFGKSVSEAIKAFNTDQPRIEVDLQPGQLEAWLLPLLEQRCTDARAAAAVAGLNPPEEPGLEVFLVTGVAPPDSIGPVPPASTFVRPAPETRVHYAMLDTEIQGWGFEEMWATFPETQEVRPGGHAHVDSALAELVGYDRDDVSVFASVRALDIARGR